ncbi:MAG: hypothetical protein HQ564_06110 [Candidatus Saganbacteria bacterium]|nr:hypothetical protein [Candidatus Saganbacteria bacterium]
MGDFSFKISATPKKFQRKLRVKADVGEKKGDGKDYDGVIGTPREKMLAAKIMCKASPKNLAKAEACLKKALKIASKEATTKVSGTDMVGNSSFKLGAGKIYAWGKAKVAIKGNKFRVKYSGSANSGAVHNYDKGAWNGNPIPVGKYSTLYVVIEGNASDAKFELNSQAIISYGELKTGVNKIDLKPLKEDEFSPMKAIEKIEFVNKPGKGQYIVRLVIK